MRSNPKSNFSVSGGSLILRARLARFLPTRPMHRAGALFERFVDCVEALTAQSCGLYRRVTRAFASRGIEVDCHSDYQHVTLPDLAGSADPPRMRLSEPLRIKSVKEALRPIRRVSALSRANPGRRYRVPAQERPNTAHTV
jgi:hypothetical protein